MKTESERIEAALAWLASNRQAVADRLPAQLGAVTYLPRAIAVIEAWGAQWRAGDCPTRLARPYILLPIRALYQIHRSHE